MKVSIDFFSLCFIIIFCFSHDLLQENITLQLDPKYAFTGSPYPFGMDPVS